ncbi:unnamed protein product [Protopolystoma xenopodis]|uniref:Uncharacterized protein n=1 Tax=Protopolystoma xenopodis TaxID=117903 RepID=A0A448XMK8_9PLAT|nr:unnamed protein product [Protopolystoma xenopodis]
MCEKSIPCVYDAMGKHYSLTDSLHSARGMTATRSWHSRPPDQPLTLVEYMPLTDGLTTAPVGRCNSAQTNESMAWARDAKPLQLPLKCRQKKGLNEEACHRAASETANAVTTFHLVCRECSRKFGKRLKRIQTGAKCDAADLRRKLAPA